MGGGPSCFWYRLIQVVFSISGLRGRLAASPLGAFPSRGWDKEIGSDRLLSKMASAAYGVGRDSIAGTLPAGVPLFPWPGSTAVPVDPRDGPREKSETSRLRAGRSRRLRRSRQPAHRRGLE